MEDQALWILRNVIKEGTVSAFLVDVGIVTSINVQPISAMLCYP